MTQAALEAARGEMAARAAFLQVLRRALRADAGHRGGADAPGSFGRGGSSGLGGLGEAEDANPAGRDGESMWDADGGVRAALREALQLLADLEREGVRMLLRADAAAAGLAAKAVEAAELARALEVAQARLLQEQAASASVRRASDCLRCADPLCVPIRAHAPHQAIRVIYPSH